MSERSPFQRFLHELRRRHVPQTAAVYLVAGWAAIQFADVVVPNLNGPQWIVTAVIVATLVGLPIVLVLAWVFDWGPEGLHRTGPEEVESAGGVQPGTPWLPAMAVLVVAIGSAVAAAALISGGGGGAGSDAAGEPDDDPAAGEVREAPRPPEPPGGFPFDVDSIERQFLEGIDMSQLGRLEALGNLGGLDSMDLSELRALSQQVAREAGLTVLMAEPKEWILTSEAPAPLQAGDTLEIAGLAQDSAGVAAVLVDGELVAESEDPDPTLRFSTRVVGTGSAGIRLVPVVVRTGDGREIRREYRIIQVPPATP
jgi:hypothetical protein